MELTPKSLLSGLDKPETLAVQHDVESPDGFRDAAVIVPMVMREGQIHLIFNKRAANLERHAGQVSFPGGRRDPEDTSLLMTALRELAEELSIPAKQHRPLMRLPARLVISYYQVTPFVSLVESSAQIVPEPDEVAYVFEVPLSHLMTAGKEIVGVREVFGEARTFYAWEYGGETIWGATGRIIADLLIVLGATHLKPE